MICIPEFTNSFCGKKFQDDISLFQEYCFEKVKRFFIHLLNYVKFIQSYEIKSTLISLTLTCSTLPTLLISGIMSKRYRL